MSSTIGSTSNGAGGFTALAAPNVAPPLGGRGQVFETPNQTDIIFDKTVVELSDSTGAAYNFNASLFEWNGNSPGTILGQIAGSYSGGAPGSFEQVTLDFPNVVLQPGRRYGFGLIPVSPSLSQRIQLGSGYASGAYLSFLNNAWTEALNPTDVYFTAYFNSIGASSAATAPLIVPAGNYDESTDIGINLNGSFGGTGQFSIPNPDQSGNTYVRYGKYGKLNLGVNGQYEYIVDDEKLTSVNTGQNVADEFPITLTYPDGLQANSTYRVQIAGYSDPSQGKDVREASISIFGERARFKFDNQKIEGVRVYGVAYGLTANSKLIPQFRIKGNKGYDESGLRPVLRPAPISGYTTFNWSNFTEEKIFVRFTNDSRQVVSNRVVIPIE
jgi:VCBS repeat-containing protein